MDQGSEVEDPQAELWLKSRAVTDRKLGAAPVDFDTFLQYIIFQANIALRNNGINDGAAEGIARSKISKADVRKIVALLRNFFEMSVVNRGS